MATSLVGRRLGKYEIQAEIGRGGMGVVYRGYDPALQRVVAVKVLPPQLAMDPDFVRRFHREAVMAAQLKHPNIVTIHDVGEHEDFHFIVMEYLEGSPLDRWLTSGLLGVDQVNRVVRQVADALDFAHKRGVVHRDIKPSNIMVSNDGHVTLMDFGLVRATEGTVLTMSGAVMGTPEYMAPEQAQGQPTDHRADIYAFGIVIYRLLVGRLPFERTTAPALIHAHVYEAPPPLRQLRPDLSRVVEAVVLKAIAKQPTDRYQSAGQLAREFEAAIGGKADAGLAAPVAPPVAGGSGRASTPPGASRPPTPSGSTTARPRPRTAPPAARQPASKMPILIGLLLLLLVAAVGGAWLITRPPETPTATPAPTVVVKTGDEVTPAPSPTPAPTSTPTTAPTATSTQVIVVVASPTPTRSVVTATKAPTATATPTVVPTATPAPTATRPVATPTKAPTKAPAPPARPGLVLDFEQDQTWRRGNEPYGAFTRSTEQFKAGASSGKLAYDFAAVTNNYVVFELRPAKALSGNPTGLTAWVFGDGSGHFLNVWIKDKASEVRAYSFGQIYHQGWQQMTAWFNDQAPWPAGHISGPDNQVLDYPVSFFQFALDGVPDGSASRGAIYLDEVFITNAPIPIGPTPTPPNVNPVPTISGSAQLTFAPGRDALAAAGSLLSLGLLLGFALLGAWPTRRR